MPKIDAPPARKGWTKRDVTLVMVGEPALPRRVRANCHGPFAVCRLRGETYWRLIHAPTGLLILKTVFELDAQLIAEELDKLPGKPFSVDHQPTVAGSVSEEVRTWLRTCRQTKSYQRQSAPGEKQ